MVVMVVARGVLAVLVGMLTVVVLERMLHRDATRPERQVVYSVIPMRDGTRPRASLSRTHSPPGSIIGNQHFFRRALYVLGLRCCRAAAAAAPGGVAAALGRRRPRSRSCAPLSFFRLIPIFDRLAQLEFFVGDVPSPRLVLKKEEKWVFHLPNELEVARARIQRFPSDGFYCLPPSLNLCRFPRHREDVSCPKLIDCEVGALGDSPWPCSSRTFCPTSSYPATTKKPLLPQRSPPRPFHSTSS